MFFFNVIFTEGPVKFIFVGNPQKATDAVDLTWSYLIQNIL